MLSDNEIGHPAKISEKSDDSDDVARDDFTDDALAALAELEAQGSEHVTLLLLFGEAVSKAKARLKHGEFNSWCTDVLKKSPSWVSAHRRLFEGRGDLEPAIAWAASTRHRWANCHSVERLLKLIAEWKKATRGDSAAAPRARKTASEIIAELRQRVADDEEEFIALRDPLPAEVQARVVELAAVPADSNLAAKEELAELAVRFHWRPRDLVAETCSAPQVSRPTPQNETSGVLP
jgi:hypothetical protein